MKGDLDKGKFMAFYCGEKECYSACGAGMSHEMILFNQAQRLGLPILKEQVKNDGYFEELKK